MFFSSHATDVMDTPGWKSMIGTHPHLIAEAFRALATQQIPPIGTVQAQAQEQKPISWPGFLL